MTDIITNPVPNGKVENFDSNPCITMVKFSLDNHSTTNDIDENRNNTEFHSAKKEDVIEVGSISSGDSAGVVTDTSQTDQCDDILHGSAVVKPKSSSMNEADLQGTGRPKLIRRNSKTSYHGSTHE